MARNEIIIEGVRHIFVTNEVGFYPCRQCSLRKVCGDSPICQDIFGKRGMFQLYQKKIK